MTENFFEKRKTLETLENLLQTRRDKRYKKGLIQCAVSFGIITHLEWETLKHKIDRNEKCEIIF